MRIPSNWRYRLHELGRDVLAMAYAVRDSRVSFIAKAIAVAPLLYLVSPVDLIPDVLPLVGWVDDVLMLPLAGRVFARLVPYPVLAELRAKAERKLLRWGPRVIWGVAAFFLFWGLLAGIGGWYYYRSFREGKEAAVKSEAVVYSDVLFK